MCRDNKISTMENSVLMRVYPTIIADHRYYKLQSKKIGMYILFDKSCLVHEGMNYNLGMRLRMVRS